MEKRRVGFWTWLEAPKYTKDYILPPVWVERVCAILGMILLAAVGIFLILMVLAAVQSGGGGGSCIDADVGAHGQSVCNDYDE